MRRAEKVRGKPAGIRPNKKSPRFLAVIVLSEWFSKEIEKRETLEETCNRHLRDRSLSPKDTNLFWNLVFGSCRWKRLLTYHLKNYLKRFNRLPLKLQMILIVGAYQIVFLSKIPIFAAVNESVELSKKMGFKWAKGLVNASLRALSKGKKKVILDKKDCQRYCLGNLINCLSNLTSHPHWMVKRWHDQFGKENLINICVNNNKTPPLAIRVNTLKIAPIDYGRILEKEGISFEKSKFLDETFIINDFNGNIQDIPGYKEGLFQVQGEASQLIGHLLSPGKGEKILDVCAGVGGKTTHLAQLSRDRAEIIATDKNIERLSILKGNLKRLEINSVKVFDLNTQENKIISQSPYDRILIDAPCSGLGVIRKHPDIKWRRVPQSIKSLSAIQYSLLKKWSKFLKPGGLLVYSVCTIEMEETIGVVNVFLKQNSRFHRVSCKLQLAMLPDELFREEDLFIIPGTYGLDGFYCAVLKRDF